MEASENEKVTRELLKITSDHDKGFPYQVQELLVMGCERFELEIGILSNIVGSTYRVVHQVSPEDVRLPMRHSSILLRLIVPLPWL